jgi:hypothetical protein
MTTKCKPSTKRQGGDLYRHPDATLDGKVHSGINEQIAALPFVRTKKGAERRCFWSVTATGKYEVDYAQGEAWARMVIPILKYNIGALLVTWIVDDMIKAGECNGLTLGFVRGLADELKNARQLVVFSHVFNGPGLSTYLKKTKVSPKTRRELFRIGPKIRKMITTQYRDAI